MTTHRSEKDKVLFTKISEGNEPAFRELFHLYLPEIRPLIYKLTKSSEVVDDIAQDVFLKIWLSRDVMESIDNPRSWILKITFHECFGYLRKKAVRNRAAGELTSAIHQADDGNDPLAYRETIQLINYAIEQLSPQTKKVYLLSRQEGLKMHQIAEELGLSLQTVKNTMGRALKSIRTYLEISGCIFPSILLGIVIFFLSPLGTVGLLKHQLYKGLTISI